MRRPAESRSSQRRDAGSLPRRLQAPEVALEGLEVGEQVVESSSGWARCRCV